MRVVMRNGVDTIGILNRESCRPIKFNSETMPRQILRIGNILLRWSRWASWQQILLDARQGGARVPNRTSGVYEVKKHGSNRRLTIGKASNLRHRIKQGLVRGIAPHSAGEDIRRYENTQRIDIRWAITSRPSAAEEELHKRYKRRFGRLPTYTDRT